MKRLSPFARFRGFSLIELMVVIAIIGVLASIAVPSYRMYIGKAKVAELLEYASQLKSTVTEYVTTSNTFTNATLTCSGMAAPAAMTATAITASWTVDRAATGGGGVSTACRISVQSNNNVINGTTVTIVLQPTVLADGGLSWACTSGSSPYAPGNCQ